jgi:hypothetical protein
MASQDQGDEDAEDRQAPDPDHGREDVQQDEPVVQSCGNHDGYVTFSTIWAITTTYPSYRCYKLRYLVNLLLLYQ